MSDVLLEVRQLRRTVGADRAIFSGLSFQLEDEDVLFVRGPSGVGKSLLLRALACLDPTQAGIALPVAALQPWSHSSSAQPLCRRGCCC